MKKSFGWILCAVAVAMIAFGLLGRRSEAAAKIVQKAVFVQEAMPANASNGFPCGENCACGDDCKCRSAASVATVSVVKKRERSVNSPRRKRPKQRVRQPTSATPPQAQQPTQSKPAEAPKQTD